MNVPAHIMANKCLPELFILRLRSIIPPEHLDEVVRLFERSRSVSVRINSLKGDIESVKSQMKQHGLTFEDVPWYPSAVVLNSPKGALDDLIQQGLVYIQSLSSMLPVIGLDPQPGDKVLDMCAAPGSKTSQMAAHMNNEGTIVAIEPIRTRFYKFLHI